MTDPSELDPLRVALGNGESVELDGGTLTIGGEESSSVLLRLVPWRARSLAHVLDEWSAVSRMFSRTARPSLTELDLSRTLEAAADAVTNEAQPITRAGGGRTVPSRHRLAALAVLNEREARLSSLQRLALVDAAAWWLSTERGGDELAFALLEAACTERTTTEHVYLALIASPGSVPPTDQPEGLPS